MRIALVAGELSGDLLGADLIRGLRARYPDARFEGIGGPAMIAEGLHSLYPLERLSVMGLVEVLRHLPGLLALRRDLVRRWRREPPDLLVGIDAPDFNLGLERRLRRSGIATAHYVSPSVWAWRQGRVKGIAESVDLMLTLFPFEARFFDAHRVPVAFVGHPAADRFPLQPDFPLYRRRLGLDPEQPVLALLPGSRRGEVERLMPLFAAAARRVAEAQPEVHLTVALAAAHLREPVEAALAAESLAAQIVEAESEAVMGAANVVLTASGTATLEAMLLKRPMVVAYRVAPLTAWLVRRLNLVRTPWFALPNLLARERVVPEYIQDDATPEALAGAVLDLLRDPDAAQRLEARFRAQHEQLRQGAGGRAATALATLLEERAR